MRQFNSILYTLIILVLILHISSSNIFNSRYVPFVIGVVLSFHYFLIGKSLKKTFIVLLFGWLLINAISIIYNKSGLIIPRIIIHTVNLLILPYILIATMGNNFWRKLEQIVFFLTLISIPLYFLNLTFQTFFNDLTSVFERFTAESLTVNENYWSSLVYVNAISDNGYGINRNSGFMWEPGAFAMMLVWAIIYNWSTKELKFDKRFFIYLIALLTTFSTAGYFALIFLLASFYFRKISLLNIMGLALLVFLFSTYVYKLEFISGKINQYNIAYSENTENKNISIGTVKVNRFQGGKYALQRTLKFPLGYGLVSSEEASEDVVRYGTNGLGSLLEMWGIIGFIYLILLLRKYIQEVNNGKVSNIAQTFFLIAILIMFFSNPISRNLFVYFIFITPLALKKISIKRRLQLQLKPMR
jgi:hypothetical protein